jgi:hypothetical protein
MIFVFSYRAPPQQVSTVDKVPPAAAAWLLSSDASHVTGATRVVTGGL